MKTVDKVSMKTWNGSTIIGNGTLTEDGRYVVTANARLTGESKWIQSKNKAGVTYKTDVRIDVAVHEYDEKGKKQGDPVIPYISMRLTSINSTSGVRQILGGVDNDSTRNFKNIILSDKLWSTVQVECKRAVGEAIQNEISGKRPTLVSNVQFIENADEFLKAAALVAQRRAAATPQAAAAAEQLLGESKAGDALASIAGGDKPQA